MKGCLDLGWMMCVIINDGNTADLTFILETTVCTGKASETFDDHIIRKVQKASYGNGGQCIGYVVDTRYTQIIAADLFAPEENGEGGQALAKIASVEISDKKELLSQCNFRIACDVTNPLCGSQGATYIYGPQKGVTPDMLPVLDAGMKNYAEVTAKVIGKDNQNAAGAGAAGGLGFAFLNYLDGELTPGIQLILDAVHIEDEMKDADVVVTGEGCLDHQTAMGKAPVGVAKLGKKYGAKTIAFAGSVTKEAVACNEAGIDAFFPIVRGISTLEEAMDPDTAKANMAATAEQVFRLL